MKLIFLPTNYIIRKYSKANNLSVPVNYKHILRKYENAANGRGYLVRFAWFYGTFQSPLNASSAFYHCILLNIPWIVRVVFYDSKDTFQAFIGTIGHEMTHKERNDLFPLYLKRKDRLFIHHINECHADYGSAEKVFGNSRKLACQTIRYKKNLSKTPEIAGKHPSWNNRYTYIQKFDFNESLIRQIATDEGCTNEKVTNSKINHFDAIRLV